MGTNKYAIYTKLLISSTITSKNNNKINIRYTK